MEEVNITNIINSSISSFKRKISFASIEISGDNVDYSDLTMKTSDKFKFVFRDKMGRIVDYFTIQNPSNVDRYSKLLFPLIFMLANVFYWAYYMYFWEYAELFACHGSSKEQSNDASSFRSQVCMLNKWVDSIWAFLLKEYSPTCYLSCVEVLALQSLIIEITSHSFFIFTKDIPMEPKITNLLRVDYLLSDSLVCIYLM